MTPDERRDHILELADETGAIIVVDAYFICTVVGLCDAGPGGMVLYRRRAWQGAPILPPMVYLSHEPGSSTEAYLVALHELGHLVKGRKGSTFEHEAFAWRYALKQAREEPDAESWARIADAMASYKACRRCKPSKDFDRLLRQAERSAA